MEFNAHDSVMECSGKHDWNIIEHSRCKRRVCFFCFGIQGRMCNRFAWNCPSTWVYWLLNKTLKYKESHTIHNISCRGCSRCCFWSIMIFQTLHSMKTTLTETCWGQMETCFTTWGSTEKAWATATWLGLAMASDCFIFWLGPLSHSKCWKATNISTKRW